MSLSDVAVVEAQRLGGPGPRALHGEGKSGFCLYCRDTAPFRFITQHLAVGLWHTGILMKRNGSPLHFPSVCVCLESWTVEKWRNTTSVNHWWEDLIPSAQYERQWPMAHLSESPLLYYETEVLLAFYLTTLLRYCGAKTTNVLQQKLHRKISPIFQYIW